MLFLRATLLVGLSVSASPAWADSSLLLRVVPAAVRSSSSWSADAPRLTPLDLALPGNRLEARLLTDGDDQRLDRHTLLAAALIAGGAAEEPSLRDAERRLDSWSEEFRRSADPRGSTRDQARAILTFMHRRILTGPYEIACSEVARTIREGRYNCVSSVVLFNALAQRCGLEVSAVECPAHVFSLVHSAGGDIDVETTCPEWFDLADRPVEQRAQLAAKTGEKTAGERWDGPRRRIDASGVAALIYYNRGVDLIEQSRFDEAVAANAKALRLDPVNAQARGNLLAAINNWALDSAAAGEHEMAVRILESGLELSPDHELFQSNYVAIHQQWFRQLTAAGLHGQVIDLSQHARQRLPQQSYWDQAVTAARRRIAGQAAPSSDR